eukprot:2048541-Prymnesium_polylepis.1
MMPRGPRGVGGPRSRCRIALQDRAARCFGPGHCGSRVRGAGGRDQDRGEARSATLEARMRRARMRRGRAGDETRSGL